MSSSPSRPVPMRPTDALRHVERPRSGADEHVRPALDDWSEHVRQMDPEHLRLLALSLPLIEQAKGILMGHYGCDADTAFRVLQRWSSSRQLKLRDLAAALVEEASRVDEGRDGTRPNAVARFLEAQGLG